MKRTTAPKSTPSPKRDDSRSQETVGIERSQMSLFMAMATDMTWRLALVVLVPIIGGIELDKHLKTTPLLTIVGFVLAMTGVLVILRRTLHVVGQLEVPKNKEKHS